MKKSAKIVLITAAVLAAVGIFLILISVALGGNKQYREYIRENGEVSVVLFPHSLKLRLSAGNGGLNVRIADDTDWDDVDDDEDEDWSDMDDAEESRKTLIASESDQIQKVDLSLGAGQYTIKPSGDNSFYASYSGTNRLQVKKQDGMLSIQTKEYNITLFSVHDTNAGSATVYLPEKAYKKIALSIGAGTAVSEMTLQAEKVELEVGMGTLEATVDASKKLTVDVGMGAAYLTVNGSEEEYDTDISVGAGNVACGSYEFSGLSQEYTTDKGAGKKLEIDCGMGSVDVDFLR